MARQRIRPKLTDNKVLNLIDTLNKPLHIKIRLCFRIRIHHSADWLIIQLLVNHLFILLIITLSLVNDIGAIK
jgi:hypothetical protein